MSRSTFRHTAKLEASVCRTPPPMRSVRPSPCSGLLLSWLGWGPEPSRATPPLSMLLRSVNLGSLCLCGSVSVPASVSFWLCLCVGVRVSACACACACVYVWVCACICVALCLCLCLHLCLCGSVAVSVPASVSVWLCGCVCGCVCVCVHVHVHVLIPCDSCLLPQLVVHNTLERHVSRVAVSSSLSSCAA